MSINTSNKIFYESPNVVSSYAKQRTLWPEENLILKIYDKHIHDRSVLDIGCGGGRTTFFLSKLTNKYIGIDYSKRMINACMNRFPSLDFFHCDATDMRIFENNYFDFILFSFNGIDCMSHKKRIAVLHEIFRVLKPSGVFAFSSHNLIGLRHVSAYNPFEIDIRKNLKTIRSYFKVRKSQIRTPTYSILSDPLAGFGHLTYFIKKVNQINQLKNIGFNNFYIINRKCEFTDIKSQEVNSNWFYYISEKP